MRDFVLIEALDLHLEAGLNVLSGGSGEGKTLLLEALRFVLGRGNNGKGAASRWVRPGASEASVLAEFELPEGRVTIERGLSAQGRGRTLIDGKAVPLSELRSWEDRLAQFFGQGQALGLIEAEAQRELIDTLAATREQSRAYGAAREELLAAARVHDGLAAQEHELRSDWDEQRAQRDALQALGPEEGEFEELITRVDQLEARAERATSLNGLVERLAGSERGRGSSGLVDDLHQAEGQLNDLCEAWPELEGAAESLQQAAEFLREASQAVAGVQSSVPFDPSDLEEAREREREFRSVARRLGVRPEALAERWERLRTLDPETLAQRRGAISHRLRRQERDLAVLESRLREQRQVAAARLQHNVLQRLPELGLREARFVVEVCSSASRSSSSGSSPSGSSSSGSSSSGSSSSGSSASASASVSLSVSASSSAASSRGLSDEIMEEPALLRRFPFPHGGDDVRLHFSANPALPLGTLREASGGELGRLFLALGLEAPATSSLLVFDEVDQNVGARLGGAVGACLERMAHGRQVLVITHLAPVAARANLHHRISKRDGVTQVETISGDERVEELALMIKGEPVTPAARAQAQELLREATEARAVAMAELGQKPSAKQAKPRKRAKQSAPEMPTERSAPEQPVEQPVEGSASEDARQPPRAKSARKRSRARTGVA